LKAGQPGNRRSSAIRVLLVDDHQDTLDTLGELLRDAGAEVATAATAAAALRVVAEFQPSSAVLDIGLPDMDGVELGRRLRQAIGGGRFRLVALSGFARREDIERSKLAGFDNYLIKPPEISELLRSVGIE
jgi:CheY-like chemotaxis protein